MESRNTVDPRHEPERDHSHGLAASIGRNTFFGMLANVIQVGTRLITVPIVIHHLGLGGYGIWNIITLASMYMRFGSIGIKTAFQKYVAEAIGCRDYQMANRLLSTGCAAMLGLSLAGLLPVCFYSHALATHAGVPVQFVKSAAGAISLLALVMLMANTGAAYEAIVTGGQRIDLVRQFNMVLSVLEAIATVTVVELGFGLFAMSVVMGISELIFVALCFFAARKVCPDIRVEAGFVTKKVLYELVRYGGSYQLVNILEVAYGAILPLAILRVFGAEFLGVQGVVSRVVSSAGMLQDSFLSPILSGGTMVYASGSADKMRALVKKAFKVTMFLSLFPLGFIATFGPTIAYAWTGERNGAFRLAFLLACSTRFFSSFSLLALVLYRITGHAVMDNLRQLLRIFCMLWVSLFATKLGFFGSMAGLTATEFLGMVFMLYALTRTFHLFSAKSLLPDAIRLVSAAAMMVVPAALLSLTPIPGHLQGRLGAGMRLGEVGLACLLIAYPVLKGTGALNATEGNAILGSLLPQGRRRNSVVAG